MHTHAPMHTASNAINNNALFEQDGGVGKKLSRMKLIKKHDYTCIGLTSLAFTKMHVDQLQQNPKSNNNSSNNQRKKKPQRPVE